jgi:hypothetical protein
VALGKTSGPKKALPPTSHDYCISIMERRSEVRMTLILNHTFTGSTIPKAPHQKTKLAVWLLRIAYQGAGYQVWLLGSAVSMTYNLMKNYLTAGWNGETGPKTTCCGLMATPTLCCHAPALMM